MFTGIVEEIGTVVELKVKNNLSTLEIHAKKVLEDIKQGDSVAVDGVCLTVVDIKGEMLTFDMMKETLVKTTLGGLKPQGQVNLERALKMSSFISGHFVSGHVDGVGVIKKRIKKENHLELRIQLLKNLRKYIVPKGSVCIDGVSLTIGEVKGDYFSIYLIPYTRHITTLGEKKEKDRVNIETDILAKYVLNR